jgi:hypothetical protein
MAGTVIKPMAAVAIGPKANAITVLIFTVQPFWGLSGHAPFHIKVNPNLAGMDHGKFLPMASTSEMNLV